MRFNITFNRTGRQRMLPMDYQYYLSAWIYKVLEKADSSFSQFLHAEGYPFGHRRFKLFCYSPLQFGKPVLWKEKKLFEVNADRIDLQVSFFLGEAAERFIIGLFRDQQVYLGDRFNGLELTVSHIERVADPGFSTGMAYRAVSPVVISQRYDGEKYAQYLSPSHEDYRRLFEQHLRAKYNSLPGENETLPDAPFGFQLLGEPRSKLITVKPNTISESRVRGYVFDFKLQAPVGIHNLMWASGAGEKNAMGFGWVEVK